jgi:autotransporter-associated beta strand protein
LYRNAILITDKEGSLRSFDIEEERAEMPSWIASGNGTWTDPANWSGGVPSASGSTATFSFGTDLGGTIIIGIPDFSDIRVGIMNINMAASTGITIRGSLTDAGTDIADLIFDNGASTAQLNINTLDITTPTTFSSIAGLRMTLASDLLVNVVNPGSIARFDLPVSGAGTLIKSGLGTLELNATNTFTGGIDVTGGILDAASDATLGTGTVTISNNAVFRSVGTVNQIFATNLGITGTAGSAVIVAAAATTLTLTGTLSHLSQGTMNFGSVTDNGTVVASFGAILENATNSSFRINGGTLLIGNAFNAANLFVHPGQGLTEINNNAILDTAGFATTISNLDFDAGTIRTSSGALNVTVNDIFIAINAQNGAVEGTAGIDQFTINASFGFNLAGTAFNNWTGGIDLITINGNSSNNALTGSNARDTINGFDGNDTLNGFGGIDTINGGNGDDVIQVSTSGSFLDGGANVDTLQILSNAITLASVSGFENIVMGGGSSSLTLTGAQFAGGFDLFSTLSGTGTITVNLDPANTVMNARGMAVQLGSSINFNVNGSSGADSIKLALGASGNIGGGIGTDVIVGGDLVDAINGGSDIDKIRGGGGADVLTGGSGADVFKYRNASDSGLGAAADIITDFVSGTDRINLTRIDTNPFLAGDQNFVFVDTVAFTNNGIAQIRWVDLGADLRIEADINGDGAADMHILLQGAGAGVLTAADFVL